ncbi:MAG: SUMF1/EgtB/PvdO family nonheme iron enzyme, partial [Bacteroidota bacterium]
MSLAAPLAASQTLTIESVEVHLAERDTVAGTVPVSFDVSWNAWRDGDRWDAAWVFGKFERQPGVWGDLRFTPDGHAGPRNVAVVPAMLPAGHARGLLIHRPADGEGPLRATIRAMWTVGASYFDLPEDGVPVRLLGVEMVHVASGPFEIGEAGEEDRQPNSFRSEAGGTYTVTSEDEIAVGETGGLYYDVPEGEGYAGGDQSGPIPAAFPKGTDAFYVMRYPITQGQYADFLSLLPPRARSARDVTTSPGYAEKGGTIACASGACEAGAPEKAANFLAWADGIGWAAWAGLRPMTEFEYEKAARGTPSDSARYADGALPDRADTSARLSHWGAVDLRGGLWERVVSVGTPEARAYRGTPGQGFIDDLGTPYGFSNADWPGTRAIGSGYRGGTEG